MTCTIKITAAKSLMIATITILTACGSGSETTNTPPSENHDTIAVVPVQPKPKNDSGFYDIPSPVQQVELLQSAGATYDKTILNPLDNVSKYTMNNSKALNLGTYSADLSYAAVFNQSQDAILYLATAKKLADQLGIKGDFYKSIMDRMNRNNGNKDSLLKIVSDLSRKSNESLKENDQSHLSALVIAGSFVEAMYIGTQSAIKVADKNAIYERIGEFRSSLSSLVGLIATVHDTGFSDILADLKSIKNIYDETDAQKLTEDQMIRITKQVKAIRIRITNT